MPGDLNIDPDEIMVEDDVSRMQEEVPYASRRPKYVRNKLPSGPTGLTTAEEIEHGKMFDIRRPGFLNLIKSILR